MKVSTKVSPKVNEEIINIINLVLVAIVFLVVGFMVGYRFATKSSNNSHSFARPGVPDNNIMCTMEAKLCPDGSYVGRSGPKCEFAKCPSE